MCTSRYNRYPGLNERNCMDAPKQAAELSPHDVKGLFMIVAVMISIALVGSVAKWFSAKAKHCYAKKKTATQIEEIK